MTSDLGSVGTLSRFPVKSMQGERLTEAAVTGAGVLGDRAYALVEVATGKVLSAKHPKVGTRLLACRAELTSEPDPEGPIPAARIALPDGRAVQSDEPGTDEVLSQYLGFDVRLESSAANGYTMDVYHPDLADLGPEEVRDTTSESVGGAAVFAELGIASPIPPGSFLDAFPVSVITTSTLTAFGSLAPKSRFDPRRFRMNVVAETEGEGFVEQEWLGSVVELGGVRIRVLIPDPRCVMTTLAQDDLPRDGGVLRALAQHNRLAVGGKPSPCAGVYAVVESPGTVHQGDVLRLAASGPAGAG